MNNAVLERVNLRIKDAQIKPQIQEDFIPEVKKNLPNPLSLVKLKGLLMDSLENTEPNITPVIPVQESEEVIFNGIEHFVGWYETMKEKFTDPQRKALDTLIQARDMINTGCGCRRGHRLDGANNYFMDFWASNASTDMPKKLKEVANTKRVIFQKDKLEFIRF